MERPPLTPYPIEDALRLLLRPDERTPMDPPDKMFITMAPGQWDMLLQAYYDRGYILLELEDENPVRAFHLNKRDD